MAYLDSRDLENELNYLLELKEELAGYGMDMGFHLVYCLSSQLFKGVDFSKYKIQGRNGDKYETTDAGYLLNQRWLWGAINEN